MDIQIHIQLRFPKLNQLPGNNCLFLQENVEFSTGVKTRVLTVPFSLMLSPVATLETQFMKRLINEKYHNRKLLLDPTLSCRLQGLINLE